MKFNKLTMGLAAVGVVSLASAARADEKMSQVQTALSNTTLSGYVDTSAQWNLGSQNNNNANFAGFKTPPYAYSGGKADGFNLNSVDIALDRPQDEGLWAAGYHVELQLGPDAPVGPVRQAYIMLRTPVGNSGIDWKVGMFDTIIGYESSSSPLDPNYTRSYGYTIEPTTHTGVLATYKVADWLTVQAGIANTSNVGGAFAGNGRATFETQKTYMGTLALTAPDSWGWAKGGVLSLGLIHAVDSSLAAGTRDNYYAGVSIPTPLADLKFGAAFDYFQVDNASVINSGADSSYAIGVYGNYKATDKLSFSARGEYFNDGAKSLGIYAGNIFPSYAAQASVEEVTLTTTYNLWANVISRVEFRWDHAETGTPYGANNIPGNGNPNHGNSFMVAANLIYQF
jgi:hypothetical protein